MKKLVIILLCLLIFTACTTHKPVASPEEVNDYLDTLCCVSVLEPDDRVEMHKRLAGVLGE